MGTLRQERTEWEIARRHTTIRARERERERERDRQTDRQTDRQRQRQTDRQREREREGGWKDKGDRWTDGIIKNRENGTDRR